jgi:replication-associated recombination protein RarA
MAAAGMLSRTKAALDTVGAAQLSQLLRAPAAVAMQWQQPAGEAKAESRHEDAVPAMVFLGPPGVGKGTYSTRVAERFGVAHVSAGDLARDEMRAGTARGRQVVRCVSCSHPTNSSWGCCLKSTRLDLRS